MNRLRIEFAALPVGLPPAPADALRSRQAPTQGGEDDSTDKLPPEPPHLQTTQLKKQGFDGINDLVGRPRAYGSATGEFTVVPAGAPQAGSPPGAPRWRLELRSDDPRLEPLRLEVAGDAIVGRASGVDVNLEACGAVDCVLSRRHALLRPSKNALYLIDLSSTNGSQCNGVPIGPRIAVPLTPRSVIKLGRLLVGNVAQVTLPDDIPSFPLVAGEIELGVSAINEAGNESEITKFMVSIDFIAPEPPKNLRLEDLQDNP